MVAECLRRARAKRDVEENVARGWAPASPTRIVYERPNLLIAGPNETELACYRTNAPIRRGDGNVAVVEALERGDEPNINLRPRRNHGDTLAERTSHVCADRVPFFASNRLLLVSSRAR